MLCKGWWPSSTMLLLILAKADLKSKWHKLAAQLIFVQLAIRILGFASGQSSTGVFEFGSFPYPDHISVHNQIDSGSVKCYGDFQTDTDEHPDFVLGLISQQCRDASNYSGRCVYTNPVNLLRPASSNTATTSFSTMFLVEVYDEAALASNESGLQGLAFIITNDSSTTGDGGGYVGWLNSTTNRQPGHNFAVELDFFRNVEFDDPVEMHVGVDVNNLTSQATAVLPELGFFYFPRSTHGVFVVWIEYNGSTQILDVTVGDSLYQKPVKTLISTFVDLTTIVQQNMFVGFSGSTSTVSAKYFIRLWTFNSDGPTPDVARSSNGTNLSEYDPPKTKLLLIITISSAIVFIVLILVIFVLYKRNVRLNALAKKYQLEELEHLGTGAQSFKYQALSASTKGFSSKQLLGSGGFGSVYRGSLRLPGVKSPTDVAVKRISSTSDQGASEFLAEVKIIGQVQHRNLVRLLGWCHERGELLLVYDYMPNGSLDQHLYKNKSNDEGPGVLTWARRLKIVSGVAMALAYLHEEWEQRVIHRDVKSSNVMLDVNFNARLGDFGLARVSAHDIAPPSTAVLAGTRGYLAPELGHTLKATEKTDVYSFGALVLEIATGKRPILSIREQLTVGVILLMDWVWSLYGDERILEAADVQLQNAWNSGEMETLLKIGLLCCHPNPNERPTMRDVLNIWTGCTPFPFLPRNKPVPTFAGSPLTIVEESDAESGLIALKEVKDQRSHHRHEPWQSIPEIVYERPFSLESSLSFPVPALRSRPWRSTPLPT